MRPRHRRHRQQRGQDRAELLDLGVADQPGGDHQLHPRSQAEVLRAIPGLNVQDTAGPGGNSNIGVRGIPVSTGGSEYVGLQEDGLPVVLFGDMIFGNNDYWVRFDNNVDRVEAVRGGSASTFSSQAPGAVINYVSKTGTKDGGEVGLSSALNYREYRVDFDYGAHLSDTVRFHVGGYVVDGNGPRICPTPPKKAIRSRATSPRSSTRARAMSA
jgi:outer membrane receptor protein involved in Fe transport